MKILYVITGLTLGGAERIVCALADEMRKREHEIKIAYLTGEQIVQPHSQQIEVIPLGLNSPVQLISALFKYKKLIRDYQPDIVHAHMVHANIFSRIGRLFTRVQRLICTAHNSNEGGKLRMLAYRYSNFLSDLNTNVSREATEAFIEKGAFKPQDAVTIYNGIDLKRFAQAEKPNTVSEKIICLSVGRLNPQKDYSNLFRAISILEPKLPPHIEFHIAGDGELKDDLEKEIESLGLEKRVFLLGKRADIPELLNQADFFILPSKNEGLPTVIIEAMACQCFVIATDCGGSAEIMGETGLLVPPQNSHALAAALQQALALDQTTIQNNNREARQRVEQKFSLDHSVQQWLNIYAQS
ncbi:glycosyltransferase [Acinetobacter sp. GSS19]|uniref:glycosyltransferase n=1 Tax=Acinetobacter sp. GSS19 TaxID=3020716 RepID=UPI002360B001|nr:glycosyltransferase [Acinetobacter sp. GSS19]